MRHDHDPATLPPTEAVKRVMVSLPAVGTLATNGLWSRLGALYADCLVRDAAVALDAEEDARAEAAREAEREAVKAGEVATLRAAVERARAVELATLVGPHGRRVFSAPTRAALHGAGLRTLGDLADLTIEEVHGRTGLGGRAIRTMGLALARYGLTFRVPE